MVGPWPLPLSKLGVPTWSPRALRATSVERGPELALVVESPFSFLQIFCSLAIRREARAFSVGVCLGWSCTSVLAFPPGMYRGRKRFQHQRPRSNMPFMMQMKQKSHPTRTAISGHDHSSKGAIAPSFAMFELKWAAHCLVLCVLMSVRPTQFTTGDGEARRFAIANATVLSLRMSTLVLQADCHRHCRGGFIPRHSNPLGVRLVELHLQGLHWIEDLITIDCGQDRSQSSSDASMITAILGSILSGAQTVPITRRRFSASSGTIFAAGPYAWPPPQA